MAVGAICKGTVSVIQVDCTPPIMQTTFWQKMNRRLLLLPVEEMVKEVAAMDAVLGVMHITVDCLGRWHLWYGP
jgi:hypothetical protein